MKKLKRMFLGLSTLFLVAGCNGSKNPDPVSDNTSKKSWEEVQNERVKITIYLDESNVYGSYVKGADENFVKEAVEKKFYEDTGNAIDLNILYESHATFSNTFGAVMAASSWDAAVSYLGQAGIEETILNQGVTMDISSLLAKNGKNILRVLGQDNMNSVTSLNGEIIGIPSVNLTKQKGVLVRKDYMTAVGYTESKAEADASQGALKWCQTIADFDDMIRKMKNDTGVCANCTTPLSGSVYDMEFTLLAGCMDSCGYQYRDINYDDTGAVKEVVPGWISKNYGKVLQQEFDWVSDGLWEVDNMTISSSARISNLSSGKSAVYFADPTITNLIQISRNALDVNPNAEFVLLDPLDGVDDQGQPIPNSGAFVEVGKNTDCMVFNKRSKKAELVIKYIDWMYSSKENYELCAYGIKDVHWKDSTFGDNYYEYADNYYVKHKPYSGAFMLVHNDDISSRIPMQYTEVEREWINKVRNYRCLSNPTDGMLFYGCSAETATNFTKAEGDLYLECATKAWSGVANPANTWANSCTKYRNQAADYITWLTNQYKQYNAVRSAD